MGQISENKVFRVGLSQFFQCDLVHVPSLLLPPPLCTLAFEHKQSLCTEDIPVLECAAAAGREEGKEGRREGGGDCGGQLLCLEGDQLVSSCAS